MHRALASLLIPALIATSGVVSLLHTHAYDDHDHPEHHHGLAAHEHHAPAPPDEATAHLQGCNPGTHAVSFAFVCATPPQMRAVDAESAQPASLTPELRTQRAVGYADVRVHGPPPRTQSSPRAPPVIALA